MPPYNNNPTSTGKLIMIRENGEEVELSGDVTEFNLDPNSLIEADYKYNGQCDISIDTEPSNFKMEDLELDLSNMTNFTAKIITQFILTNVRSHRNKRINKKWAKKYGTYYKPVYQTINAQVTKVSSEDYNGMSGGIIVGFDVIAK